MTRGPVTGDEWTDVALGPAGVDQLLLLSSASAGLAEPSAAWHGPGRRLPVGASPVDDLWGTGGHSECLPGTPSPPPALAPKAAGLGASWHPRVSCGESTDPQTPLVPEGSTSALLLPWATVPHSHGRRSARCCCLSFVLSRSAFALTGL